MFTCSGICLHAVVYVYMQWYMFACSVICLHAVVYVYMQWYMFTCIDTHEKVFQEYRDKYVHLFKTHYPLSVARETSKL